MAEKVVIRKYESKDHADVCRIFKDGMHENWWPAYRRIMTGTAVKASAFQALLLALLSVFTPSFFHLVIIEVLLQCFLMLALFHVYWDYASTHLATDMADPDLKFWTGRGRETSGFFVAVFDGYVVGTISYERKEEGVLEIFRLSVDSKMRGRGVALKLVDEVLQEALDMGEKKVVLETSSHQTAAIRFYNKTGWTESHRFDYHSFVLGVEIVGFYKNL